MPIVFPVQQQYVTTGVDFDGTTQYTTKASELTGLVDGKVGILSLWFRFDGGDGAAQIMFRNLDGFFDLRKLASNVLQLAGSTPAPVNVLLMQSTTTYTAGAAWHHLLASWDLANTTGHLYIDGVNVINAGTDVFTNDTLDYTTGSWYLGASNMPDRYTNGCFADVYFNSAQYLDFSSAANRSRFATSTNKPVDLGPVGATPTGTRPIVYFRGPAADFNTNLGSGGNFTVVNGPLVNASTNPSS